MNDFFLATLTPLVKAILALAAIVFLMLAATASIDLTKISLYKARQYKADPEVAVIAFGIGMLLWLIQASL